MDSSAPAPVDVTQGGPVAVIRMQDPARRNALSASRLDRLIAAFD